MPDAPPTAFTGFSPGALAWFTGLERDNSKAYFTATRDVYENDVRGELEAMLERLSEEFGGDVRVFRQQRDLRFTPDKSPYKTRTYGVLRSVAAAGFYAELSARGLYAATGYHELAADQLERFRAAVADDTTGPPLADLVAATRNAGLEVTGEVLRTAPRGYSRDHPRIVLLRHKLLIAGRRVEGAPGIGPDAALDHVASTWRAAAPLTRWLDTHVGPSTLPPERRR